MAAAGFCSFLDQVLLLSTYSEPELIILVFCNMKPEGRSGELVTSTPALWKFVGPIGDTEPCVLGKKRCTGNTQKCLNPAENRNKLPPCPRTAVQITCQSGDHPPPQEKEPCQRPQVDWKSGSSYVPPKRGAGTWQGRLILLKLSDIVPNLSPSSESFASSVAVQAEKIFIPMVLKPLGILKMSWVLIPTGKEHFGLKSNLELVTCQEKLKPHAPGEIIRLFAAVSNQHVLFASPATGDALPTGEAEDKGEAEELSPCCLRVPVCTWERSRDLKGRAGLDPLGGNWSDGPCGTRSWLNNLL
ncbi:hypothetical protein BTVI_23149 [Pitangus sulphuratus]|nr:hypothetical protein BTVI_23149 [Pitangus sulphuratus]